jgi:hypothetical protein
MLAGRLVRIARDILDEYAKFAITQKLEEAHRASTQRGGPHYIQLVRDLRTWGQTVLATTKFANYPDDLQILLKESKYATALPSSIAQLVMTGFPDDPSRAIQSSEVGFYTSLVNTTHAELSAFLVAATKFNAQEILVPENEISLDLLIPRPVFENETATYLEILSRFSRIMSYLIELTTGSARAPTLTYTSTSDPVTGFAMVCGAAWAFLKFYKLLLEVAEKQLSLIKTIKDFRASALADVPDLEGRIEPTVEKALEAALEKTVTTVEVKVSEARVNEIKTGLIKDARLAVKVIGEGVRVNITIESLDKLPAIVAAVPGLAIEEVTEELASQRALEKKVAQTLVLLGETSAILLPKEGGPKTA